MTRRKENPELQAVMAAFIMTYIGGALLRTQVTGMLRRTFQILGSSVFLGKIGVAPACRSPSPPVGFTVILAGQKGLGMNTKIHPNCNLTATLQSGQAADART